MLSNENPNALSDADRQINFAVASGKARALAKALINYDRQPNPMREREAANPAHGVHVRILRPMIAVDWRVEVSEEVKRHNSMVSNLGKPE